MLKRYAGYIVACSVVALATAACGVAVAQSGPGKGSEARVEGTVTFVGSNGVTIASTTVFANANTKIERNGVRVPLSSIHVGDFGQARYDAATKVASKIESRGK